MSVNKTKQEYLYRELEEAIRKNESHILLSGLAGRKTGKTKTIIELSKKYNLPILVDNGELVRLYQKEYGIKAYNANAHLGNLDGLGFDMFLVDDVYSNRLEFFRKFGYKVVGLERSNLAY